MIDSQLWSVEDLRGGLFLAGWLEGARRCEGSEGEVLTRDGMVLRI